MTIAEQEAEEQAEHATDYANCILSACSDFGTFALMLGVAAMGVYVLTLVQGEKEDTLHAALFSLGLFGVSIGAICKTIPAIYNDSNGNDASPEIVPMV